MYFCSYTQRSLQSYEVDLPISKFIYQRLRPWKFVGALVVGKCGGDVKRTPIFIFSFKRKVKKMVGSFGHFFLGDLTLTGVGTLPQISYKSSQDL